MELTEGIVAESMMIDKARWRKVTGTEEGCERATGRPRSASESLSANMRCLRRTGLAKESLIVEN